MNIKLSCLFGCGGVLALSPPKQIKHHLLSEPKKARAICGGCEKEFSYWGEFETRNREGRRRYCLYLQFLRSIIEVDAKIEVSCPVCTNAVHLPKPKKSRRGWKLGPERTTIACDVCGLKIIYWGRRKRRQNYIRFKFPVLYFNTQRIIWQHRLGTEENWVKPPASQTNVEG